MLRIRKRSFLLFEIIAAITLVAICLLPLIRPHARIHRSKTHYLQQMQMDNIAQSAFCILKQKLFENKQHSWKDLMKETSGELDTVFPLITGRDGTKKVKCFYKTRYIDHTEKQSPYRLALLIEVEFDFPSIADKLPSFKRTVLLEERQA